MSKRVALAGFLHETNTFAPTKAQMSDFVQGGGYMPFARGADLLQLSRDINLGIGGAVEQGESSGWEMVPVLWAGAIPSAHVCKEAYKSITDEIVAGISAALPLDGVFIDLHGAMVAEHEDDGEGALLQRVRAAVGPGVKIAAALDLHGNITQAMVDSADVLVGFRTYPHVDMAETGRRAAVQLDRLMTRRAPFAKAFRRLPFLVPIAWQSTQDLPARGIYQLVAEIEREAVSSTSFFFGFPAADFPGCGPTVICYGESQSDADAAADQIEQAVLKAEPDFVGKTFAPDAGVIEAMQISESASRPVVIADTQDNPGAGATQTLPACCALWFGKTRKAQRLAIWWTPKRQKLPMLQGRGPRLRSRSAAFQTSPVTAPMKGAFPSKR
jgi:microcystin degradation protein MlrC